ncbi:MAG: TolC family protein [Acidobacteriota bacterium]|nr:TolC family protein [Acidobacteriota bacterium]
MRKSLSLILFCSVMSAGLPCPAQASRETLTLDRCIAVALGRNPLLQSSEQAYRASLARVHQARAIQQPTLDFDSDLQPGPLDFRGSGESYLGLSQELDFPGKRSLRGKIAARESGEFLMDTELLKIDLVYQVKQAFFGLLLAQEIVKYAGQDLELAKDFLQKAEIKYAAGDVARVEVLRARVEAAKTDNSVKAAANGVRLAKARLNFLLARKKYEPLEISGEFKRQGPALDLEELQKKALAARPEIKRIGYSMDKESYRKTLGHLGYLPDFSLGLSRHRLAGEPRTWDFTLSLRVPLYFWQPLKGEIAEAEASLKGLTKEREHIMNAIALEVEESFALAQTAGRQIDLFEKEILAQAEEAYSMFLFSFQEGEIGGIELIEARRTLIEAKKSHAEALNNFNMALATLEKSIGQDLEESTHD